MRSSNDYAAVPNDPNFILMSFVLCKTECDSQFLRCDTNPGICLNALVVICIYHCCVIIIDLGDDRILIFASNKQLGILQSAHHFMSDGTFKVVPEIFYQLYIIHTVYRDHLTPVSYALLRRKNAFIHERLFNEILKFAPEWAPKSMMIDYEKSCINAYRSVFPHTQ